MINVKLECPICGGWEDGELDALCADDVVQSADGIYLEDVDIWCCDTCWEAAHDVASIVVYAETPSGERYIVTADDEVTLHAAHPEAHYEIENVLNAIPEDPQTVILAQLQCERCGFLSMRINYIDE